MSLVCGERCGEKRRVAPDRVLPADPQVVAGIYCQRQDVLQELLVLDLLLAELVEGLQPVGVGLGHHPPGSHLEGRDVGRQLRDVREEVGVLVFLQLVGMVEGFLSIKARSKFPDEQVARPAIDYDDVRPVGGEADRGRDRAAVGCLVSLEIRVDLEPGLVQALYDVLYNSVVPICVPPLVERYPARGKQVSEGLADAATGQGTLVGRRLAPLLQVGVGRKRVDRGI